MDSVARSITRTFTSGCKWIENHSKDLTFLTVYAIAIALLATQSPSTLYKARAFFIFAGGAWAGHALSRHYITSEKHKTEVLTLFFFSLLTIGALAGTIPSVREALENSYREILGGLGALAFGSLVRYLRAKQQEQDDAEADDRHPLPPPVTTTSSQPVRPPPVTAPSPPSPSGSITITIPTTGLPGTPYILERDEEETVEFDTSQPAQQPPISGLSGELSLPLPIPSQPTPCRVPSSISNSTEQPSFSLLNGLSTWTTISNTGTVHTSTLQPPPIQPPISGSSEETPLSLPEPPLSTPPTEDDRHLLYTVPPVTTTSSQLDRPLPVTAVLSPPSSSASLTIAIPTTGLPREIPCIPEGDEEEETVECAASNSTQPPPTSGPSGELGLPTPLQPTPCRAPSSISNSTEQPSFSLLDGLSTGATLSNTGSVHTSTLQSPPMQPPISGSFEETPLFLPEPPLLTTLLPTYEPIPLSTPPTEYVLSTTITSAEHLRNLFRPEAPSTPPPPPLRHHLSRC